MEFFHLDQCMQEKNGKNTLSHNIKESEKIILDPSLYLCNPADKPTNQKADTGKNITSLTVVTNLPFSLLTVTETLLLPTLFLYFLYRMFPVFYHSNTPACTQRFQHGGYIEPV